MLLPLQKADPHVLVVAQDDTPAPEEPTEAPTEPPTEEPTEAPTEPPTEEPTTAPPTDAPTPPPTPPPSDDSSEVPTPPPSPTPPGETPSPNSTPAPGPSNQNTPAPFDGQEDDGGPSAAAIGGIAGGLGGVLLLIVVAICCCRRRDDYYEADSPLPAYAIGAPAPQDTVPIRSQGSIQRGVAQTRPGETKNLYGGYARPPAPTQRRAPPQQQTSPEPAPIARFSASQRKLSQKINRDHSQSHPREPSERSSWGQSTYASDSVSDTSYDMESTDGDARNQWLSALASGQLDAGHESRDSARDKLNNGGSDNSWNARESSPRGTREFNDIDRDSYEL